MKRRSDESLVMLLAKSKDQIETNVSTVYFDGSCPLCTFEIACYKSQAGGEEMDFVDISQENAQRVDDLCLENAMRRFHVRTNNGELLSGARAFVAVWGSLRKWRWAAGLAQIPGCLLLLETVYRLFLPIRPALSKIASLLGARAENPRS